MLTYSFDAASLSAVRFGVSPLSEMGLALRAFRAPERYPLQRGWLDRISHVRPALDEEILRALVDDRRWVADFVTPRPTAPMGDIHRELATLRTIGSEQMRHDLRAVHGAVPPVFEGPYDQVMDRLIAALEQMWLLCFAPHWARMRSVLEADIAHRGRAIAREGIMSMLGGLSPAITWSGQHLDIRLNSAFNGQHVVGPAGVTLAPSVFVINVSTMIDLTRQPTLIYPARGQGAMWSPRAVPGREEMSALIGQTRTRLLHELGEPASSTELAFRTGVSASAINQHLRAMYASGLLTRTRYGRSVLYYRSEIGDALLGGRETVD
ncbi:MAG: DUF5937 family protein [Mycetocola sp.]